MELSVILPAYKEAENLKKILPKINEEVLKLNIELNWIEYWTLNVSLLFVIL